MNSTETTLQAKGIRPTAMRILVLRAFEEQSSALSLKDLETCLPNADRVTLFRTVKTFVSKGVLHPIEQDGVTIYGRCQEACEEANHLDAHPHFSCVKCGTVQCLSAVPLPRLNLPNGFEPTKINLIVEGVCQGCTS